MSLLDELQNFIHRVFEGNGLILLPTDRFVIPPVTFPADTVSRDELGIIMQKGDDGTLDGGDSAHRGGMLAFCGSIKDHNLLGVFEDSGIMVRHPTQFPWNNPHNCSRDQLIAYAAGCWRAGRTDIVRRLLEETEARNNTCQNIEKDKPGSTKNPPIGDPILPHEHMFLRVCAGHDGAHWDLAGQWLLQVSIEAVKEQDDPEINQLLVESIVCCRLDHFVTHIPDFEARLHGYWSGWRRMPQVAVALTRVAKKELERYRGFIGLPFPPLPLATIKQIVDMVATTIEEIKKGNLPHVLDPTKLALVVEDAKDLVDAAIRDAKVQFQYYANLGPKLFEIGTRLPAILAVGGISPIALLGSTNDADMREIKSALAAIDGKLTRIIEFLTTDFGPEVRKAMIETEAEILATRTGLQIANYVQPLLAVIADPAKSAERKEDLKALRDRTALIVSDACTAVAISAASAPRITQCFVGVFSAGATLLRHDMRGSGPFVKAWCESIMAALQGALVESTDSTKLTLEDASRKLPTLEEASASAIMIAPHERTLAVYWGLLRTSPKRNLYAQRFMPLKPGEGEGGGHHHPEVKFWQIRAYGALLHTFNMDTNEWQIDDNARFSQIYFEEPSLEVDYLPHQNELYFRKSWWPVSVNFGGDWAAEGRRMKAEADRLTSQSRRLGARLAIDAQIALITDLIDQAAEMHEAIVKALAEP